MTKEPFKLKKHQQQLVDQAREIAQLGNSKGRHAPDELAQRMTLESKSESLEKIEPRRATMFEKLGSYISRALRFILGR